MLTESVTKSNRTTEKKQSPDKGKQMAGFGNKLQGHGAEDKAEQKKDQEQPQILQSVQQEDRLKAKNQLQKMQAKHPAIEDFMKELERKQKFKNDPKSISRDIDENQPHLKQPIYSLARGDLDYMHAQMDPMNPSCRDHQFCGLRVGRLSQKPDEEYPLAPNSLFFRTGKSSDQAGSQYQNWLLRNFYQRGIQYKKQMLKDGSLPPSMKFEDDNIRKYDPRFDPKRYEKGQQMPQITNVKDHYNTPATASWLDSSDKFSKEAKDQRKSSNQPNKIMSKRKTTGGKVQNLNSSQTNLNNNQDHFANTYTGHSQQNYQQFMGGHYGSNFDLGNNEFFGAQKDSLQCDSIQKFAQNQLIRGYGGEYPQFHGMGTEMGMPTTIEEVTNTKEWIWFVENKKKLIEESKDEEKEKPKFADECVDYPRDAPRDHTTCCNSKLHETMQKVKVERKHLAVNKEAIVKLTKEELLAQQEQQISDKAQQTIDKAINEAMVNYYGPLTEAKAEEIKVISQAYTGRRNGPFSQSLGTSLKQSNLVNQKSPQASASQSKNVSEKKFSMEGHGEKNSTTNSKRDPVTSSANFQQHSKKDAQSTAPPEQGSPSKARKPHPVAKQPPERTKDREFLDKMWQRCRFISNQPDKLINSSKLPDIDKSGEKKEKSPEPYDFTQCEKNSQLMMLKQQEIDDVMFKETFQGIQRQTLKTQAVPRYQNKYQTDHLLNDGDDDQSEGYGHSRDNLAGLSRFLSNKRLQKIKDCKNNLHQQKLFAETIIVNARTGKNLKPHIQEAALQVQRNRGQTTDKATSRKQTVFEQYQGQLNIESQKQRAASNRLLSKKVASVLNYSKMYQLSQMTEDVGIYRYLQKQYQKEIFNLEKSIENGQIAPQIAPQKLQELKKKYFDKILTDLKEKNSNMRDAEIYEKIIEVDKVVKDIFKDILEQKPGLLAKGGKMQPYQFNDENTITMQMIGDQAIQEAQEQARAQTSPFKLAKDSQESKQLENSQSQKTNFNQIQGKKLLNSGLQVNEDVSLITSLRSEEGVTIKTKSVFETAKNTPNAFDASAKGKKLSQTNRMDQMTSSNMGGGSGSVNEGSQQGSTKYRQQIIKAASGANQKNVQQVYLDSDYWYHKGVVLNQKGMNQYALNCYMQALKLNKDHRASIFNLACAYEKLDKFKEALDGFQHAISVDEKWPDAHYGLALCCLRLKEYKDAVKHITNAMHWSIEDYKRKVQLRKEREDEKWKALKADIDAGNTPPKFAQYTSQGQIQREKIPIDELCPENNEPTDELYIDDATEKNKGVSTHIMYVRALCHREIKDYKTALESYAKVMLRHHQISNYEKMIEKTNFQNLALKTVEGPGYPGWFVCLYSHFKRLSLLKETHRLMMVDLRAYYKRREGWIHDRIPNVIKDLQLIRFFNRFDRETLYQMMKKTDLRVIQKDELLFLEPDQCAIIINGNLFLFSHKNDVATPSLQAIYNPGDIIGNPEIDGKWSRDDHSWIIAYQECDILIINKEYVDYLWDKMKSSSEVNYIANKIQATPWFKNLTEQTIYTIAFDLMLFKKFANNEKICPQFTKSKWNLEYTYKRKEAVKNFKEKQFGPPRKDTYAGKEHEFSSYELQQIYRSERYPNVKKELCEERQQFEDYYRDYMNDFNIRLGKGWIKTIKGDEIKTGKEDHSNGSNRSNDKDKNEDDEDAEENHKSIFSNDDQSLYEILLSNYLPPDKEEREKIMSNPDELRVIRDKVKVKQENFKKLLHLCQKRDKHYKGILQYMGQVIDKLEEYQEKNQSYPSESDGLYILIEGNIYVRNDFDKQESQDTSKDKKKDDHQRRDESNKDLNRPKDLMDYWTEWRRSKESVTSKSKNQKGQGNQDRPECMDLIGVERFLQVQGYTYYGSAYASSEQKNWTTCGFIKKELLYLIPFYDLYQLKKDLEEKYKTKCKKYADICQEKYGFILTKLNSQDN